MMRSRLQLATTLLVFAAPLALWLSLVSEYIPWGDDWAAYLLQARALADGRAVEELAKNTAVISSSDLHLGPYAYPWGYPLLLAAIGPAVAWDPLWLKAVGAASLLLLSLSSYTLARQFFAPWGALAVTSLATLQVMVIDSALLIASDLAYTATAVAGLALATRLYATMMTSGAVLYQYAALLALLSVLSFAIRSNGAVLPCAFILSFATAAALRPQHRRVILAQTAALSAMVGLGGAVYFIALPDGSLIHLDALSFDPSLWLARARDHASSLLEIVPGGLESKGAAAALVVGVAAMARGAIALFAVRLLPLGLFVAGHLALLTLFPAANQGLRYYLPVATPALIIFAVVIREAYVTARARLRDGRPRAMLDRFAVVVTVFACVASPVAMAASLGTSVAQRESERGPYSESTQRMAAYVKALPAGVQVVFRKPRALRYLTGRHIFAISKAEHLIFADCYVFDPEYPRDQVTVSELEAAGLRPTVEFPPLRVFER